MQCMQKQNLTRSTWTYLDVSGCIWLYLDVPGPTGVCPTLDTVSCAYAVTECIWTYLVVSGCIWAYLEMYGVQVCSMSSCEDQGAKTVSRLVVPPSPAWAKTDIWSYLICLSTLKHHVLCSSMFYYILLCSAVFCSYLQDYTTYLYRVIQ